VSHAEFLDDQANTVVAEVPFPLGIVRNGVERNREVAGQELFVGDVDGGHWQRRGDVVERDDEESNGRDGRTMSEYGLPCSRTAHFKSAYTLRIYNDLMQ